MLILHSRGGGDHHTHPCRLHDNPECSSYCPSALLGGRLPGPPGLPGFTVLLRGSLLL